MRALYPEVLVLHDGGVNPEVLAGPSQLGVEGPYHILGFTDLSPADNEYNRDIGSAALGSTVIIVEQELLRLRTTDVAKVLAGAVLSPVFERLLTFGSDHQLTPCELSVFLPDTRGKLRRRGAVNAN